MAKKPVTVRTRREWALVCAAAGMKIFPLPPNGKVPYLAVEHEALWAWKKIATSDAAQINAWFDGSPDMNYGLNPGKDFLVIDADEKLGKNGIEKFIALNMEEPTDDWCIETFTVKSPSKGRHYILRTTQPVSNSNKGWPEGIDIRGADGYVVGPGCHTTEVKDHRGHIKAYEGDYIVEDECEFAQAPQWVLNRCFQYFEHQADANAIPLVELDLPSNVERAREFLSTRKAAIEGRNGDDWTYQTIAKLKDIGISEDFGMGLVTEPGGWNDRCAPPWEGAELADKFKNVYRYGQNQPGNKSDMWDRPGAFTPEEYLAGIEKKKKEIRDGLDAIHYGPVRLLNRSDRREHVIPEWLPAHGMTALLAIRSTGKTVQMIDMACRLASDMEWHGLPIMKDFAAVYICGEDDVGARDQFKAWCEYHKKIPKSRSKKYGFKLSDLVWSGAGA